MADTLHRPLFLMMQIAFSDQLVTYDKFLNDVAARVAALIQKDASDPAYI